MIADHESVSSSSQIVAAEPAWRRSTFCASGSCVEVATNGMGVGIRDSKDLDSGELWLSRDEFRAFITAIKDQNFA
jgi:uncharacterized protein DUF397